MRHTILSVFITLIFILTQLGRGGSAASNTMPTVPEMGTLAVVLALFGVPHGATDHLVAAAIFKRSFPRTWLLVFVVMYLSMMGAVVLCWRVAPVLSLVSFLLMSVVHWGLGDAEEDLVPTSFFAIEVCIRGGVPILLPCVAFQDRVSSIFGWLVGPETDLSRVEDVLKFTQLATVPFTLALLACIGFHASLAMGLRPPKLCRSNKYSTQPLPLQTTRHAHTAIELVLLPLLCITCPPLVSFMIYFCLWHSVRHILCVSSATFDPFRCEKAVLSFSMHAAPFTIATLVLASVVWSIHTTPPPPLPAAASTYPSSSSSASSSLPDWTADMPALAQVIFIGLNAVTVPHMVVTELSRVRQRAAETARGVERDFSGGGEGYSEGRDYSGGARDSKVSPTGAEMSFL